MTINEREAAVWAAKWLRRRIDAQGDRIVYAGRLVDEFEALASKPDAPTGRCNVEMGPCACGAWHTPDPDEFTYVGDGLDAERERRATFAATTKPNAQPAAEEWETVETPHWQSLLGFLPREGERWTRQDDGTVLVERKKS